jgi:membrane-associated phospholipid phosphatase
VFTRTSPKHRFDTVISVERLPTSVRSDARPAPSPARALAGAVTALAGLIAIGLLIHRSTTVRWADSTALHGFDEGEVRFGLTGLCERLAHLADPASFALLGAALVAVAIVRGQYRVAAAVPLILAGANITTQLLKPAVATPRLSEWLGNGQIPAASWPSGHATASMSLVLCAILVSSPRLRPLVATAGALLAVGVGYSLLALGWHFPSDVLGGYLVATMWALVAVAGLRAADRRWPARTGRAVALRLGEALAPPLAAVFAAIVVAAGVYALNPEAATEAGRANATFVAGAFAIAGLGLAVATALVLVLRR